MKTMAILEKCSPATMLSPVDEVPFQIHFDDDLHAIVIRSNGFWSLQESNRFLAVLGRFINEARRSHGVVRIMIDARNCAVQSAEAAACFSRVGRTLVKAGDMLAVVATASLVKMQFQRVLTNASSMIFAAPQGAAVWLSTKH